MGGLLVCCPATGKEFSTGIQLDDVTFRMLTATLSTAYCPYCRADHRWTPRQARLAEAIPPQQWVESYRSADPDQAE
jgi:hypothetical protein